MKLTFYNEVIQFDYELGTLIKASEDPMFTSYLSDIKIQIQNNPESTPALKKQVIANYGVYADKMNKLGCPVEKLYFRAVYGDMEAPEIKNPVFIRKEETPVARQSSPAPQEAPMPQHSSPVPQDAPMPQQSGSAPQEAVAESLDSVQTVAEEKLEAQSVEEQPADHIDAQPQVPQSASFDPYTGRPLNVPVQNDVAASASVSKKTEFAVGAIVMSVIGSVFLLTGLVYFSINFLDTFAQGMVMYLVCAIVLGVSEFVIRKLVSKLSAVFTAIGISGVFLTTVVNYRSLENLNLPVTAVILGVCAVLVCIFGYIRKSQLYSIIGFLAAFISSIAIGTDVSPVEYMVITLCTLIISSLWLLFPVDKYFSEVTPVMLGAVLMYLIAGSVFSIDSDSDFTRHFLKLIFYICCMTVINFIYYINTVRGRKTGIVNEVVKVFNMIIYAVSALYCSFACLVSFGALRGLTDVEEIILGIIIFLIVVISEGVFTYLLRDKQDIDFSIFYISFFVMGMILTICVHNILIQAIILMAFCLISRFMTRYESINKLFKVTDLVLQAVIALIALAIGDDTGNYVEVTRYIACLVLIAGLIASIFIGIGYINIIQIFSVFAVTIILGNVIMPEALSEAGSMGVVLLFTLLVNNIKRIKGKDFYVFNWFALVWSILLLIFASHVVFSAEEVLIFSISAVFGLAIVILLMNKDYGMPFHDKYIIIPAYLTFLSFLVPIKSGFILSIILMAIAVISVIIGFVLKEKSIRVYGLILSIVICAKIALVDFVAIGDVRSKTIMYILVGAFALAIGCIYMVLESRESKAARMAAGTQYQIIQPQPDQVQFGQPQFVQPGAAQPANNVSVEGNTENKELYEENKTV